MQPPSFPFPLWFAPIWLAGWVGLSIVYRRIRNKPIFFFSVPGARFVERMASGCSNDRWWRRLGGAGNCLVVALTENSVIIRPWFPFNLLFLPELYGLEFEIPLSNVLSVTVQKGFFRSHIRLRFRHDDGHGDVSLVLKRSDAFLRLLGQPEQAV